MSKTKQELLEEIQCLKHNLSIAKYDSEVQYEMLIMLTTLYPISNKDLGRISTKAHDIVQKQHMLMEKGER